MFILRRILPSRTEENTEIGDYYRLICKKSSPKEFEKFAKEYQFADTISAIVMFSPVSHDPTDNETYMPILSNEVAYIMSESGQTFARIN